MFYWWVYEETRLHCSLRVPDRLTFDVNNGVGKLSQLYTNFSVGFGTKILDFQINISMNINLNVNINIDV